MFVTNEDKFEYRFGDSGPKYLMKGPRANFALVAFQPGQDFDGEGGHRRGWPGQRA